MSESIKSLFKNDSKFSKHGRLLFSYKTTTSFDDKFREYIACFMDKSMLIVYEQKAKAIIDYTILTIKKDSTSIIFKWKNNDKKNKFVIPIDNEKLLHEFYNNISEKIRIEKIKKMPMKPENKATIEENNKKIEFKNQSTSVISFRDPELIYVKVEFNNLNFFVKSKLAAGLKGLKKSIIKRIGDHFYPNKDNDKSKIDLEIFKSLKFYLKHKRSIYLLDNNDDLISSSAFLDNKIQILVKK